MEAVEVPRNLDLTLNAAIAELLYDDLVLRDTRGQIIIRDGTVRLNNFSTQMLDGQVELSGTYDSRNLSQPAYDMSFNARNISVPETYRAFTAVQALAPIAKRITGRMDGRFSLGGLLSGQMKPVLPSLQGGGKVTLRDASVANVALLGALNQVASLNLPTEASLRDIVLQGQINDGMLRFQPFNFQVAQQKFTLQGANGFDQTINYDLKTQLPLGKVKAIPGIPALQGVVGSNNPIDMVFKVTGTHDAPKVSIGSVGKGAAATVKEAVTDRAKEEADRLKKEAEERARQEADRLKKEGEERARQEADRLKKEAQDRARQETEKLKKRLPFGK